MDENVPAGTCSPKAEENQPRSGIQASSSSQLNESGLSPLFTPAIAAASETTPAAKSPSSSPLMEPNINDDDDPTPSTNRQLRPRSEVSSVVESDLIASAMEPLTSEERRDWPGWVELESDPVRLIFL
jgi:ubiquitin carboxyl-terminal hydrolase L5